MLNVSWNFWTLFSFLFFVAISTVAGFTGAYNAPQFWIIILIGAFGFTDFKLEWKSETDVRDKQKNERKRVREIYEASRIDT